MLLKRGADAQTISWRWCVGREFHLGAAFVHPEPSAIASFRPVLYSAGVPALLTQKRLVKFFDVDTPILKKLDSIRDLEQLAS